MLKVAEVYEKQVRKLAERPDGSEYVQFEKELDKRDCLINPAYVVSMYPHEFTVSSEAAKVEAAFPPGTKFTRFILDGNSFRSSEMVVVGSFSKYSDLLADKT